jgi:ABC-type polysaccharide/polyol phosphate transport system ATPase subunit
MTKSAVVLEHVTKHFRLYHERNQTLKGALLRGRRARFEEFVALDDVTFEIPAGTTFGLVGPNGSGKSTLLKCIARILRPDQGTIAVHGSVSALLELGAGFHPELSGRDNIYLNGSILGLSKRQLQRRFEEIVAFSGLETFIDQPVKNYSSGMYVRLGFSIAINVDPEILLVDEVLAVGDQEFQRKCEEKFAELKAGGRTIVLVSHGLDSVRAMCDEVAWLEHGVVKDLGSPGRVIDKYVDKVSEDQSQAQAGHDSTQPGRIGSGEIRTERIELLDHAGAPLHRIRSGEPLVVRIRYRTTEPVSDPAFRVTLNRHDGVHVTTSSTRYTTLDLRSVDGSGVLELRVPALPLVPAQYEVDVSIRNRDGLKLYDKVRKAGRFEVFPTAVREVEGIAALGGEWRVVDVDGIDAAQEPAAVTLTRY